MASASQDPQNIDPQSETDAASGPVPYDSPNEPSTQMIQGQSSEETQNLDDTRPEAAVNLSQPRRRLKVPGRNDIAAVLLLILVLGAAAYFRFVGQNWDDYTHLHPDERFMTDVASSIGGPLRMSDKDTAAQAKHLQYCMKQYPDTGGAGPIFDAVCSNWNPNNVGQGLYVYGELPLFVTRISAEMAVTLTNDTVWVTYSGIHLIGRTVSAVADLLALVFLFLIGRRLYNAWVGLLAAALYAAAVFPIQLSHFWTADAFSTLPVVVTFWFSVRILDRGRFYDFVGGGIALGAALASRINTLPLFGVIVLAALIYMLPAWDVTLPSEERWRLFWRAFIGCFIAAFVTFWTFRITQPHAFTGGPGLWGFVQPFSFNDPVTGVRQPAITNMIFYRPWLDNVGEAQYLTSGLADFPPNHQWASRTPYLFAWQNIVLWGMGVPLGLMAWIAWVWASIQVVRSRPQWTRHILVVVWILVYFGYMGRQWVMTMRYFQPLYPFLVLIAAWGLAEIFSRSRRWAMANPTAVRRLAAIGGTVLLIGVLGFTFLWADMFTSIYRRVLTRVEASYWIEETAPSAFSMVVKGENGQTRRVNTVLYGGTPADGSFVVGQASVGLNVGQTINNTVSMPIAGTISQIDIPHLVDPVSPGADPKGAGTVQVRLYDAQNGNVLAQATLNVNGRSTKTSALGDAYTLPLESPISVIANQQVRIEVTATEGGPFVATGTVIATEGQWDDAVPTKVCQLPGNIDPLGPIPPGLFSAATCAGVDGFGTWYRGLELNMAYEDVKEKFDGMQQILEQADYLTISSNRFYDSLSRIPTRFPVSIKYYNALFSGQLGYDLVKTVTSTFAAGPIEISDQYLPTYTGPKWLNEFEAEEAFHVYDHPAVFIFKKNPNYNPAVLAAVLNSVPLTDATAASQNENDSLISIIRWGAFQASPAPTGLMMNDTLKAIQTQGGTWSDLFNRNWFINASPLTTVVLFWLAIMVIGFAAWPIIFTILPGLPDRGYPISKLAGLLIVSWIVWAGGTLKFLTWSAPGIALMIIGMGLISAVLVLRNRTAFSEYVRLNWRHFVIIELITVVLFIAFLFVRLGNPDLWAQSLGGEKPMDFAYFNAVLRSTVFPPYDAWYSGGYLNYYYFGYVLVGTPVKLLGIVPSVSYNLVLPMLFAMTGIGAFSVAFNIAASRWFFPRDEGEDKPEASFKARRRFALRAPLGNPYMAGVLAMLLCAVFGNLDTPRVFATSLINSSGRPPVTDMFSWKVNKFIKENGRQPSPQESLDLQTQADHPSIIDSVQFTLFSLQQNLDGLSNGIGTLTSKGIFPGSPDRWFWGPRSIVGELDGSSNEINEMPYFTFVFADLHAHMIAMPITLLVLAWLLSEVMAVGYVTRSIGAAITATAFGGLAVGILQPTNTWDWPTYLALGILTLTLIVYLRPGRFGRRKVVQWLAHVGGFGVAQYVAALPFTMFFATAYLSGQSTFKSFQGNKTPLWAYLDIHGVFLFIVVSLLIWQTVRLLKRTYVRDFIGRAWPILLIGILLFGVILVTLFLWTVPGQFWLFNPPFPTAILCVPLIAWCIALFFVPDTSREMRVVYTLTALAVAVSFFVEIVVFANDIGRQNTFFKFYIQAWILFSVVSGVGLAWLLQASERWRAVVRIPWLTIIVLLLSTAALFPIMSTQGKIAVRMAPDAPHTLDGDAYMANAVYYETTAVPLKDDLNVIHWLEDNVKGTPVILEAHQYPSEYKLDSRISINTGLPTLLGWRFHQQQQRTIDPLPNLVIQREANVYELYDTPDIATAWRMLKFYEVQYIIVNKLEQSLYKPEGLAKFDDMVKMGLLEQVYNADYTETVKDADSGQDVEKPVFSRIYHVVPGASFGELAAKVSKP